MTTRIPETYCPTCGTRLDATTHADLLPKVPTPGAISVCFYCAEVLEYDENLKVRMVGPDHHARNDEQVIRLQLAVGARLLGPLEPRSRSRR